MGKCCDRISCCVVEESDAAKLCDASLYVSVAEHAGQKELGDLIFRTGIDTFGGQSRHDVLDGGLHKHFNSGVQGCVAQSLRLDFRTFLAESLCQRRDKFLRHLGDRGVKFSGFFEHNVH